MLFRSNKLLAVCNNFASVFAEFVREGSADRCSRELPVQLHGGYELPTLNKANTREILDHGYRGNREV